MANFGMPTAGDMLLALDPIGAGINEHGTDTLGWGLPSVEASTTWSSLHRLARLKAIGDGATLYGIANNELRASLMSPFELMFLLTRQDQIIGGATRQIFDVLDSQIRKNLPSGWNIYGTDGKRPIDAWLTRLNGTSASAPAAPTWTPTMTATTGGAVQECGSGSLPAAPRVKVAYVGAYDNLESQPSAAATAVALGAGKSGWTIAGHSGNVPTGVTRLRIYRQLLGNAGAGDPFYWDNDVDVVAGTAWNTYTFSCLKSDDALRYDIEPVTWVSCMQLMSTAQVFMFANASLAIDDPGRWSGPVLTEASMLSAHNVLPNVAGDYMGISGVLAHSELGRKDLASTFAAQSMLTANDPTRGIQGFFGVYGLGVRVITALDTAGTITEWTATYVDAAHPTTPQTDTTTGESVALAAAVDSRAELVAGSGGRIYRTCSALAHATSATGVVAVTGRTPRTPI